MVQLVSLMLMGKRKMVYLRFLFHFRLNVMVVLRWMTIRDDRGDRGGGGLHRGRHHRLSYYYFFVCFAFRNNPITFYFFHFFKSIQSVCSANGQKYAKYTETERKKGRNKRNKRSFSFVRESGHEEQLRPGGQAAPSQ